MTAAEAGVMTDRAVEAVTLARETIDLLGGYDAVLRDVAARLEAAAEWADDAVAGGAPPKWVIRQTIAATLLTAAAARGETATP